MSSRWSCQPGRRTSSRCVRPGCPGRGRRTKASPTRSLPPAQTYMWPRGRPRSTIAFDWQACLSLRCSRGV
eukprot:1192840-Prorocentrum_minimum.AAC.3